MERVQRAEKRSAGTLGSGEPSPQSKLMLASERTRTGLPLTSGLVKYSPFQAAPGATAVGGAGVRVGAGAAGLVGSGVSVGGTGLGDGIWVGVADGAIVAVGAAVGNAVGEFARVAVAATVRERGRRLRGGRGRRRLGGRSRLAPSRVGLRLALARAIEHNLSRAKRLLWQRRYSATWRIPFLVGGPAGFAPPRRASAE